jgi:CubicO group peptidase (beta-lactamase class C family)
MTKTKISSKRIVTRRAFLYSSATMLAGISVLKPSSALVRPKVSPPTDYSSAIEKIKQTLPVTMAERDITGASIALVDGENIVWSKGFGYTDRSRKVKVTADTPECTS